MNLRRRLFLNTIFSLILILVLVITALGIQHYKKKLQEKQDLINTTTNELITLHFVTSDYLIFYNTRSFDQWEIQFKKIRDLISRQPELDQEFKSYLDRIEQSFDIVLTISEKTDPLSSSDQNFQRLIRHSSIELQIAFQDGFSFLSIANTTMKTEFQKFQNSSNLAFSILVIFTGVILIYQTQEGIRKIIHPLNDLLKGVTAIQNGDYSQRIPLNTHGSQLNTGDELGQLAFAFNQMASQLSLTLKDLQTSVAAGRDREQLLEGILNTNPNMIYLIDSEGKIVLANKAMATLYGSTPDELIGKDDFYFAQAGFFDQETAKKFHADDMEVIKTQKPSFFPEESRTNADGKRTWIQTLLTPFNLPEKSPMVLGVSVDITEHVLGLEAVRASEKLYRELFNAINDAIFIVDMEGRILNVNQAACDRLGYTEEEFQKMTAMDIDAPEYSATAASRIKRTLEQGKNSFSVHQVSKDGIRIPAEIKTVVFDYYGQPAFLSICRDMSQWEEAQRTLVERTSLLYEVLNTAPDMIYLVNEHNVVEMANQTMADMYGVELDELIGRSIQEFVEKRLITQANADDFQANNRKVFDTQKELFIAEESATRKDGTTVWFQTTLTPFNQPGRPKKVIGVSTDITHRKKSEDHVYSMNQILESLVENRTVDLQKANEELRSFAYSISHDLRAPLRAIDGFSKILVEEYSSQINQEAKRYLSLVQQNAVMMGKLIEGLLEFSRKGRQEMHLQTIETGKLVSAVLEDIRYDHPDHKAQVHIAPLPSITGDPLLIKQVYQNLLHNAFKFTSKTENPQIEVGCDMMEGQQIYYVKDNGTGFDMKYVDRLFGVFQRLHRTDEFEGTGVGLAITKRIIMRHGGTIWAEAEVGKGAGFYFTFTTLGDIQDEQK